MEYDFSIGAAASAALTANRNLSSDQALADLLTRASVQLFAENGVTQNFWQINPTDWPLVLQAMSNLNSVLAGAQFISQPQGQTGSVFEYRFLSHRSIRQSVQ